MSGELPPGWAEVSLADVVSQPRAKVAPADYPDLPFVGMDHIAPDGMDLLGSVPFGSMKSNGGLFLEGDVLYGRMRPYLNKVHRAKSAGACSAEFIVFPKSKAIDGDFLAYTLHHRTFVNFASAKSSGDRPRVDFGDISKYEFALPPKPEQKRIVSKIDELFSRIDEGERALERVSKLLGRYRQSVLKAAVTGELTHDWREARKAAGHPVESGEALLARILTASREAWEQAELAKMQAKGIAPKGDAWKKRYSKPTRPDVSGLPHLPEGWVWASLPMLCGVDSTNGISVKGTNAPPGIPALRLDAMGDFGFDYSAKRYIPIADSKAERLRIETGDFFVSRANGSLALVGRAVLAQEPPELVVFPDTMIRYRTVDELQVGCWLERVWRSRLVREQIERKAKTTAGIYKISQGDIAEIAIPVPPPEERAAAISLIDQRLSQIDSLSTDQGQSQKRAGALRQAILRSAFSGGLVSQCPNDEPALILLERIAAERAVTNAAAPKRGRKKKSA